MHGPLNVKWYHMYENHDLRNFDFSLNCQPNLATVLISLQDTNSVFYVLLSSVRLQDGTQSSSGCFGEYRNNLLFLRLEP
jgi:hypothetical protein